MKNLKINNLKGLIISSSVIALTYLFQGISTLISPLNLDLPLSSFIFSISFFVIILRPLIFLFIIYFGYKMLKDLLDLYKIIKKI